MSWRNKETGVIHAHSLMVSERSGFTACGRVQLWDTTYDLREDFEYYWPKTDVDRAAECRHCRSSIQEKIDWLRSWTNPEDD